MDPILVLERIEEEINEQIELLKDALSSNNIADMEEYRFITGQVRGLQHARQFAIDLRDRLDSL